MTKEDVRKEIDTPNGNGLPAQLAQHVEHMLNCEAELCYEQESGVSFEALHKAENDYDEAIKKFNALLKDVGDAEEKAAMYEGLCE